MSDNSERAPRVWLQINGINVNSVMHADISNNGPCQTSRFELTVSTSGSTTDTEWQNPEGGRVSVAIYMRMRQDGHDTLIFEGLADSIATDVLNGHYGSHPWERLFVSSYQFELSEILRQSDGKRNCKIYCR